MNPRGRLLDGWWLLDQSVCHNLLKKKVGKLIFHAPIGALVFVKCLSAGILFVA